MRIKDGWPNREGPEVQVNYGGAAVDGTAAPFNTWPIGTLYIRTSATASSVAVWQKKAGAGASTDWHKIAPATAHIDIPLVNWRAISGDDIQNLVAHGGLLAKDSAPILEYTNGDTDSAFRIRWAATVVTPIAMQVVLPTDLDDVQSMTITLRAAMAGATDTPVIDLDSYFNQGDTKVSDASAAITGVTAADYAITVGSADVPPSSRTLTMELTPAAHGTDALYVYGTWLSYVRK